MGWNSLEINRLTAAGESKRRIRCLSRHITVFRATNPADLDAFSAALCGDSTADRFSILLDGAQFSPSEHALIGFGEIFPPDETRTVEQFLVAYGAPADVEPLLLKVGLGGLRRRKVTELTAAQGHTLRILAAVHDATRVLILKEPFNNISESWREAIADLLADFAWKQHAIVIVTHLSYRPQGWIENEVISRVQVERPRQATIGFGGASLEADVIQAIRADFKAGATTSTKGYPLIPPAPQPARWKGRGITPWIGLGMASFAAFAMVIAGIFINTQMYTPSPALVSVVTPREPSAVAGGAVIGANGVAAVVSVAQPQPAVERPKPQLLDRYPNEVKEAVLLAFNKPEESVKLWYKAAQLQPVSARPVAAVAPVSSESYETGMEEASAEMPQESESELAARREEIRRKFLEAIQSQ